MTPTYNARGQYVQPRPLRSSRHVSKVKRDAMAKYNDHCHTCGVLWIKHSSATDLCAALQDARSRLTQIIEGSDGLELTRFQVNTLAQGHFQKFDLTL